LNGIGEGERLKGLYFIELNSTQMGPSRGGKFEKKLTQKFQSQNCDFLILNLHIPKESSGLTRRSLLIHFLPDNFFIQNARLELLEDDFVENLMMIEFIHVAKVIRERNSKETKPCMRQQQQQQHNFHGNLWLYFCFHMSFYSKLVRC
jgi:hypothetical protein